MVRFDYVPIQVMKGPLGDAVRCERITVSTTATPLSTESVKTITGVLIRAESTNTSTVYVGNENVTISNGFPLSPGDALTLEIADLSKVYVITDSGTQYVRIIYVVWE